MILHLLELDQLHRVAAEQRSMSLCAESHLSDLICDYESTFEARYGDPARRCRDIAEAEALLDELDVLEAQLAVAYTDAWGNGETGF